MLGLATSSADNVSAIIWSVFITIAFAVLDGIALSFQCYCRVFSVVRFTVLVFLCSKFLALDCYTLNPECNSINTLPHEEILLIFKSTLFMFIEIHRG